MHGIQEVSSDLGLTPRTLRFYEESGLIAPQRVGSTRVYTRRDIGRLRLIQRGKRLGFTIREIKEFLDLYDADPAHIEQARLLLGGVEHRIADLHKQRHALDETIAELEQLQRHVTDFIRGQ